MTFSRLLGFDHNDSEAPSLFDIFVNGVDESDMEAAQMYQPGKRADGNTTFLKPYFYVLNNLLRNTMDPKIGETIHIQHDAPKILVHFGANGGHFSISDFMWFKIEEAAIDPHKSLPYAPYLMQIIEQVVGHSFSLDCTHPSYSVRNLGPHLRSTSGVRGAGTAAPSVDPADAASASPSGAPSSPPRSSSKRRGNGGGAIKYALQKFFAYFCYKAERDDHRLRRLEQQANIDPPSPLRLFLDPFNEYDALYGT
jgi:hypothetical protein